MFSRRRSRGHYDPQQYNTGMHHAAPSASASAAANAFYQKQLGPSAAAEALRRHSLDHSGANAMRDFQPHAASPAGSRQGGPPRRANSLTTRSYQGLHSTPQRLPGSVASRNYRSPSMSYSPGLSGGPPRRNSLSSDRTNSLTRTHTVVNRDSSGRTMSLTTTTIRQMGSFELVQTKDVPIASPTSRLARPSPSFNSDFSSRANSLHSLDSELVGIQEEPEEDMATLERRLNRLGDPIDIPLTEEPEEEEYVPKPRQGHAKQFGHSDLDLALENGHDDVNIAEQQQTQQREQQREQEHEQLEHQIAELSDVSDATQSPVSEHVVPTENTDLPAPSTAHSSTSGSQTSSSMGLHTGTSAPLHREVSPARSALRNNTGSTPKTKVSFGGADEPYVYESYEYEDQPAAGNAAAGNAGSMNHSPGIAAATAVARSRSQNTRPAAAAQVTAPAPTITHGTSQQTGPMLGASSGTAPTSRRRLVMSQPPLNVQKRPSQSSLSGKQSSTRRVSPNMPYPHRRPWDASNESFVDAPSSLNDLPVPERSAARPRNPSAGSVSSLNSPSQGVPPKQQQGGPQLGRIPGSGGIGLNGLPKNPEDEYEDENLDLKHEEIHAQAVALAQAAFNNTSVPKQQQQQQQPTQTHHYRSLVDDDDSASIRSDSSFTRERRRAAGAKQSGVGRMRSLRQPATPSLRTGGAPSSKNAGRKSSLLNQAPPNLDIGGYSNQTTSASAGATVGGGPGLRTFSLRNTNRPDPATLLAASGGSKSRKKGGSTGNSGQFRSRIADSDSEDEGGMFSRGSSGGPKRSNANGKISLGDVFSPGTDVKDIFKSRASSDSAVVATAKPKKKAGFFKRVFGKKN